MNEKFMLEQVLHGPVNKSRSISKHLLGLGPYFKVYSGISMKQHGPCWCLFLTSSCMVRIWGSLRWS